MQKGNFLVYLSKGKVLPEAVRTEARRLLRHCLTAGGVLLAGKVEELSEDRLTEPFLSSSID